MVDRQAWAEVDLSAIRKNARALAALAGDDAGLCAVVKADGYGHGAAPVARACIEAGATSLAVAFVEEGVELRRAGIVEPVLVLGYTGEEGARRASGWGLSTMAVSVENARVLAAEAERQGKVARVHLKVDTGMARLGVSPDEAGAAAAAIASMPGAVLEGVCSHFAAADAADGEFAALQLSRFTAAVDEVRKAGVRGFVRHIANSAALIHVPAARLDMVRPGIALYGLRASTELEPPYRPSPAMSLRARVVQVRLVPAGESVGYGRSFRAGRDARIGTLPLGYADGVSRGLSNRGSVGFPSGRAPIVGRVCMDQMMVDLTDLPKVGQGDVATVFGPGGPSVSEVADLLGTIDYEVVCAVSKRVPRIYSDSRMEEDLA
ncbi:MAG: alanine racemase [Spirochaetes bacterium]|nr:alanine racemase [Spirochaetota bacterium]MBU1081157.1 alanine racemase [Spirochaetota bacterium]